VTAVTAASAAERGFGLYIHVPFCGSICSYCDFARTADHGPAARARYVDAVLAEFELRRASCAVLADRRRTLETCYLGGGTPSELEPELMTRLLTGTVGRLAVAADCEVTAEANPETLTPAVADAWRAAGIARVSLGVQSLQSEVLALLGRACGPATARRGLALACRTFPRVSADWIVGPGLIAATLLDELSEAADMGVEHFSVYILELHAGTALADRVRRGQVVLPPDAHTEALYLAVVAHLEKLGFPQYEVSNFARPGGESRHNRNYWRGLPWLGLGPGAHGFWGRWRYANHRDVDTWQQAVTGGRLPVADLDPLDRGARRLEGLILALRTTDGIPLPAVPDGALDLERGVAEGLWKVRSGRLVLTGKGFLRIDSIEEALAGLTP
jgi:oxygen-independent coproporphyrinogen-3 oxidase